MGINEIMIGIISIVALMIIINGIGKYFEGVKSKKQQKIYRENYIKDKEVDGAKDIDPVILKALDLLEKVNLDSIEKIDQENTKGRYQYKFSSDGYIYYFYELHVCGEFGDDHILKLIVSSDEHIILSYILVQGHTFTNYGNKRMVANRISALVKKIEGHNRDKEALEKQRVIDNFLKD